MHVPQISEEYRSLVASGGDKKFISSVKEDHSYRVQKTRVVQGKCRLSQCEAYRERQVDRKRQKTEVDRRTGRWTDRPWSSDRCLSALLSKSV